MSTQSPIIPELLAKDATIKIRCIKGISSFTVCCHDIDMLKLALHD